MIVVEGADNSGKSTFGKALALPYYSAGPAPKDDRELEKCLKEQRDRASKPCVQDRLTCISHQVYNEVDLETLQLLQGEIAWLVDQPTVIVVYCRPPERTLMDMSTHKLKSYDTEENIQRIIKDQHLFIERYDELMSNVPHLVYDWTEDSSPDMHRYLTMTQHSQEEWKTAREMMRLGRRRY